MIGAKKLNKNDIVKIKRLIAEGLNDYQIARQFIPESGEQVSREHIRNIRLKKRWNMEAHSFIMKNDLNDLTLLKTEVNGMTFETQLGWLRTATMEKWFFLTLIDDEQVDGPLSYLMDEKPRKNEIFRFHNSFVASYL